LLKVSTRQQSHESLAFLDDLNNKLRRRLAPDYLLKFRRVPPNSSGTTLAATFLALFIANQMRYLARGD